MSYHEFDFEQSNAMRIAIDMVVTTLGNNSEKNRTDIARIVLSIASEGDFSAGALARMTLDKLDDQERKTA
jgi:hypothetical protein